MIDAAIVRVAKARRLISHNELLAEVAQQVRAHVYMCVCIISCRVRTDDPHVSLRKCGSMSTKKITCLMSNPPPTHTHNADQPLQGAAPADQEAHRGAHREGVLCVLVCATGYVCHTRTPPPPSRADPVHLTTQTKPNTNFLRNIWSARRPTGRCTATCREPVPTRAPRPPPRQRVGAGGLEGGFGELAGVCAVVRSLV